MNNRTIGLIFKGFSHILANQEKNHETLWRKKLFSVGRYK